MTVSEAALRQQSAWSPPGTYVWDAWFARAEGRLHAFFLGASREACGGDSERRHDLASIGHAVFSAGGFEYVGPALAAAAPGAWDDLAVWTGSVVPAQPFARWALFYTARRRSDPLVDTPNERQRPQRIGVAFSDDLARWERSPRSRQGPVLDNPGPASLFDGVSWRDPYVVRGEDGCFHAFVCARLAPGAASPEAGGAVAHVVGTTPDEWGKPSLLLSSEDFYQLEVPQVFWRRGLTHKTLFLIFSAQQQDCSPRRRARMPAAECQTGTYFLASETVGLGHEGLPPLREPARLLAEGVYAGRLVDPETDERPLFFGFPWPCPGAAFEGGIAGPRHVLFSPDGDLRLAGPGPGASVERPAGEEAP